MKEQLLTQIEQQIKDSVKLDYIHLWQDYDEELDEAYDEYGLIWKDMNGETTEIFLWEDGEARFQQWRLDNNRNCNRYNEYDFESLEAFTRWWQVFAYTVTR